jgi:hypothetical protein
MTDSNTSLIFDTNIHNDIINDLKQSLDKLLLKRQIKINNFKKEKKNIDNKIKLLKQKIKNLSSPFVQIPHKKITVNPLHHFKIKKKLHTTLNTQIVHSNYKKTHIPSTLKRLVWNKYIGEEIGKSKCFCCKLSDITQLHFHCGHIVAEKNGGRTDLTNLLPICQNCNSSMRTMNMNEFIKKYKI